MSDYREELRKAIRATHGAESRWLDSVPVTEVFRGETVFEGTVEVFALESHAKAQRCYAWGYQEAGKWKITAVLELPPVTSPQTAVKVAIAAHARQVTSQRSQKP